MDEVKQLEQRAWVRLGELVVLDVSLPNHLQTYLGPRRELLKGRNRLGVGLGLAEVFDRVWESGV
ncbi:hypothetical protein JAAARDRAFT_597148 [Jaapia argillacea MUCL 33604]|uniref:Uncharacterized protein n=1 Tax=Jaapia argillacea MUCL 33604 TaxID=933084 RepID=A0A067Q1V2_9AGAM|nr:hypothetical protein JAAARDRAFT_597148 [Jaapia argillacea MUCL 33604]